MVRACARRRLVRAALAAAGTPICAHALQVAATALAAGSQVATLNADELRRVPRLALAALAPFVRR